MPVKAVFVASSALAAGLSRQTTAALQPAEFLHTMYILVFEFFSVLHQIIKTRTKRLFRVHFVNT